MIKSVQQEIEIDKYFKNIIRALAIMATVRIAQALLLVFPLSFLRFLFARRIRQTFHRQS